MLSQSFGDVGDDVANEADTVTAVEFDHSGNYLATGDRGGRVVVFRSIFNGIGEPGIDQRSQVSPPNYYWSPFFQFQSHEAEFDYLKSVEIEERINQIKFCQPMSNNLLLLSTNDKAIKLWKVGERPSYQCSAVKTYMDNHVGRKSQRYTLPLPKILRHNVHNPNRCSNDDDGSMSQPQSIISTTTVATPRRIYTNAHLYHINSVSVNSDNQTFLSADDLRVNIWDIECQNSSFNVIDIKPSNMEELTEVITSAHYHPQHCHQLAYSTSKGRINLCDLRVSALMEKTTASAPSSLAPNFPTRTGTGIGHNSSSSSSSSSNNNNNSNNSSGGSGGGGGVGGGAAVRVFDSCEDTSASAPKTFFSEIIASISDIKFSHDGRYIISRDYLTVKTWDSRLHSRPVHVTHIHEHLKPALCNLFESDCIFDKFELCSSPDGSRVLTGSYSNQFKIFSTLAHGNELSMELPSSRSASVTDNNNEETGLDHSQFQSAATGKSVLPGISNLHISATKSRPAQDVRTDQKVLHCAWHPYYNTVAVAGQSGLYMYKI